MERLPACPLLKSGRNGLVCLGGVNFFAVGEDRALCRRCELVETGQFDGLLSCRRLEVYTYLTYEDQRSVVRPIFECDLPAHAPARKTCAICPAAVSSTQEQETTV